MATLAAAKPPTAAAMPGALAITAAVMPAGRGGVRRREGVGQIDEGVVDIDASAAARGQVQQQH